MTKPSRLTQPCIPPGTLNGVPALIGWGKGRVITSAGWQVAWCDSIWHVSFCSDGACCKLLCSCSFTYFTYFSLFRKLCIEFREICMGLCWYFDWLIRSWGWFSRLEFFGPLLIFATMCRAESADLSQEILVSFYRPVKLARMWKLWCHYKQPQWPETS